MVRRKHRKSFGGMVRNFFGSFHYLGIFRGSKRNKIDRLKHTLGVGFVLHVKGSTSLKRGE